MRSRTVLSGSEVANGFPEVCEASGTKCEGAKIAIVAIIAKIAKISKFSISEGKGTMGLWSILFLLTTDKGLYR